MMKRLVAVVLVGLCVSLALISVMPTRSSPGSDYGAWYDINDDGVIDGSDIIELTRRYGTAGTSLAKASLEYDSGWINITDKLGQRITITHDLNITDWNNSDIMVDITGKTELNSGLLRHLGLTGLQGWDRTYGGTGNDGPSSMVQTSDGGYALGGRTYSFGAGGDFWLVKTQADGNMEWNKTYGGTDSDVANALVQTADGGYALAGITSSFGAGHADSWLVKTDVSGNLQWNRTYGGTNDDYTYSMVQASDGGCALAGTTSSFGAGGYDFWLIKTDVSGNMEWNKTYGGTNDDYAYCVIQTSDNGYALAGTTSSLGAGGIDAWLVKTDANGNMEWNKTYGGTSGDCVYSVIQMSGGGYALAGQTYSFGAGGLDAWLVKTDASGNALWNKTYGGTNFDYAYCVIQTSDSGYALAGYTSSFGAGGLDFWLVKTDLSGNMQWNKTYGGTMTDGASSIVQTSDGGYTLAGVTMSFGAGGFDVWLVKTGCESGLAWIDASSNSITLHRGATDGLWNYIRILILKAK